MWNVIAAAKSTGNGSIWDLIGFVWVVFIVIPFIVAFIKLLMSSDGAVVFSFLLVAVSLLFPIAVLACFAITWASHSGTSSFALNSPSIALTEVPGKTVAFELHGKSYGAYWASSNGLDLTPNDSSPTLHVVAPANATWPGSMTICISGPCQGGDTVSYTDFTIPVRFTLPSSYMPGTSFTGTLSGDLTSPQPTGDFGHFYDDTQHVSIPVTVKVVAHPAPAPSGTKLFGFSPVGALIWLGAGLILLVPLGKRIAEMP